MAFTRLALPAPAEAVTLASTPTCVASGIAGNDRDGEAEARIQLADGWHQRLVEAPAGSGLPSPVDADVVGILVRSGLGGFQRPAPGVANFDLRLTPIPDCSASDPLETTVADLSNLSLQDPDGATGPTFNIRPERSAVVAIDAAYSFADLTDALSIRFNAATATPYRIAPSRSFRTRPRPSPCPQACPSASPRRARSPACPGRRAAPAPRGRGRFSPPRRSAQPLNAPSPRP